MIDVIYTRYSQYQERPEAFGLELRPAEPFRDLYPLAEEEIGDLVYFFDDVGAGSVTESSAIATVLGQPGRTALRRAVSEWKNAYTDDCCPVLEMTDDGESITVRDTRPVAVAAEHRLHGLPAEVLRVCEEGRSPAWLQTCFDKRGVAFADVEEALADLVARKLVIDADGRYLSLTVPPPVHAMIARKEYPGGQIARRRPVPVAGAA